MKKFYYLKKSTRKNKKYDLFTNENVYLLSFGDSRYEDFTIHKDENRKENYIIRHQKNEHWGNIKTAGFWSRWVLWNLPTIKASLADIENKFGIIVILLG